MHHYWLAARFRSDRPARNPECRSAPSDGGPLIKSVYKWMTLSLASPAHGYGPGVGHLVDVDELVSARTMGQRLGFSGVHLVHYYFRSDASFPDPVYVVPDMARPLRLWCWPDVEAWWSTRPPRQAGPGRPALGRKGPSLS